MPNHVTNRIEFPAALADAVRERCFRDGSFTFETLIPCPAHVYLADISADDEEDFPCNWDSWNRQNWGTKWDAYSSSLAVDGDVARLTFDTAWSAPRPVVVAFANTFRVPFVFKSFDEGHCFWLVEEWGFRNRGGERTENNTGPMGRLSVRRNVKKDRRPLCIELKGYDPDEIDKDGEESAEAQDGAA